MTAGGCGLARAHCSRAEAGRSHRVHARSQQSRTEGTSPSESASPDTCSPRHLWTASAIRGSASRGIPRDSARFREIPPVPLVAPTTQPDEQSQSNDTTRYTQPEHKISQARTKGAEADRELPPDPLVAPGLAAAVSPHAEGDISQRDPAWLKARDLLTRTPSNHVIHTGIHSSPFHKFHSPHPTHPTHSHFPFTPRLAHLPIHRRAATASLPRATGHRQSERM